MPRECTEKGEPPGTPQEASAAGNQSNWCAQSGGAGGASEMIPAPLSFQSEKTASSGSLRPSKAQACPPLPGRVSALSPLLTLPASWVNQHLPEQVSRRPGPWVCGLFITRTVSSPLYSRSNSQPFWRSRATGKMNTSTNPGPQSLPGST